jgi:hypothetical protein
MSELKPREPSPEEIQALIDLGAEEIARIVLCLLIDEAVKGQIASLIPGSHRAATSEPERTPRRSA